VLVDVRSSCLYDRKGQTGDGGVKRATYRRRQRYIVRFQRELYVGGGRSRPGGLGGRDISGARVPNMRTVVGILYGYANDMV
jgi:hypothetical protein